MFAVRVKGFTKRVKSEGKGLQRRVKSLRVP